MANENSETKTQIVYSRYHRLFEIEPLILPFRDFYFEKKRENPTIDVLDLVDAFNQKIAPQSFYPFPAQLTRWRRKWDTEFAREFGRDTDVMLMPNTDLIPQPPTGELVAPKAEDLEGGADTLAGALLNDAFEMLKSDKEIEETFTSDELIKRKAYVLNVMTYVTKLVQGKQGLAIKANAEKRETANFMMDLMKRATAGNLSATEIAQLKRAFATAPVTVEAANVANT